MEYPNLLDIYYIVREYWNIQYIGWFQLSSKIRKLVPIVDMQKKCWRCIILHPLPQQQMFMTGGSKNHHWHVPEFSPEMGCWDWTYAEGSSRAEGHGRWRTQWAGDAWTHSVWRHSVFRRWCPHRHRWHIDGEFKRLWHITCTTGVYGGGDYTYLMGLLNTRTYNWGASPCSYQACLRGIQPTNTGIQHNSINICTFLLCRTSGNQKRPTTSCKWYFEINVRYVGK